MKELQDLLQELRCDINCCKVSYDNDTEINNANDTLLKIEKLVKKLTIQRVVGQSEQFNCLIENENKGIKACMNCCGEPECKINNN